MWISAFFLTVISQDWGQNPVVVKGTYHDDLLMWNHLISAYPKMVMPEKPRGAIIPHHALVAGQLGSFYSALAEHIKPKTIYILCPNHYEKIRQPVVTAVNVVWETVFGNLTVEKDIANELIKSGLAYRYDDTFRFEHGIFIHTPFIKHYFPEARIVPLLFYWKNDRVQNDRIARWISERFDEESFILASVDFSHFQPAHIADFHDEGSRLSIEGWMVDTIYEREIDSPSSVYTLMKTMEILGNRKVTRHLHTNSDRVMGIEETRTTSHQYYTFSQGDTVPEKGFTVLIGGPQTQVSTFLPSQTYWSWNRSEPPLNREKDLLFDLRGEEDRFLVGADLYIFHSPEGKDFTQYEFLGGNLIVFWINDRNKNTNDFLAKISAVDNKVPVIAIFDTETIEADWIFFEGLAKAGVNAVIRRGPGSLGMNTVKGVPIFTGMGGFTGVGSEEKGFLIGLAFNDFGMQIWTFPILVDKGYPRYDFNGKNENFFSISSTMKN